MLDVCEVHAHVAHPKSTLKAVEQTLYSAVPIKKRITSEGFRVLPCEVGDVCMHLAHVAHAHVHVRVYIIVESI